MRIHHCRCESHSIEGGREVDSTLNVRYETHASLHYPGDPPKPSVHSTTTRPSCARGARGSASTVLMRACVKGARSFVTAADEKRGRCTVGRSAPPPPNPPAPQSTHLQTLRSAAPHTRMRRSPCPSSCAHACEAASSSRRIPRRLPLYARRCATAEQLSAWTSWPWLPCHARRHS